ncbi:hypothetical protein QCD60_23955 [Pokkaliibacter sp. MBI-7]|uniref:hypothetical protein n=1 Tax=Pokkaliibacter sp. MBI-7 TaxID=3040600 RepID=UPI00244892A4|nr:hypothetical protein [Pokkaliibacter sp. MBI-7]MDH2435583.1 hypothetical protein [Pokkaliibacter sp. MBI-7]
MSAYPDIDALQDTFTASRIALEQAVKQHIPEGADVDLLLGGEWVGPYRVLPYEHLAAGQVKIQRGSNPERYAGFAQLRPYQPDEGEAPA